MTSRCKLMPTLLTLVTPQCQYTCCSSYKTNDISGSRQQIKSIKIIFYMIFLKITKTDPEVWHSKMSQELAGLCSILSFVLMFLTPCLDTPLSDRCCTHSSYIGFSNSTQFSVRSCPLSLYHFHCLTVTYSSTVYCSRWY